MRSLLAIFLLSLISLQGFSKTLSEAEIDFSSKVKIWAYGLTGAGTAVAATGYYVGKDITVSGKDSISKIMKSLDAASAPITIMALGGATAAAGIVFILGDIVLQFTDEEKERLSADILASKEILDMAIEKNRPPRDENLLTLASIYTCETCETDQDVYKRIQKDWSALEDLASNYTSSDIITEEGRVKVAKEASKVLKSENLDALTLILSGIILSNV